MRPFGTTNKPARGFRGEKPTAARRMGWRGRAAATSAAMACALAGTVLANARPAAATQTCGASYNVCFNGGSVIHNLTVDEIFWIPTGRHFEAPSFFTNVDANYENQSTQFVKDLNGSTYYNLITQYGDASGRPSDTVNFGASAIDTDDYPKDTGCASAATACLSDASVQSAVLKEIRANNWTADLNHMFLIFLTSGTYVVTNPGGGGYHGVYLLFNPPMARFGIVTAGDPSAPQTFAHELLEEVTNPDVFNNDTQSGRGWWDPTQTDDNNEIGDKCSGGGNRRFDPPTDAFGANIYLNGHGYDVPPMWSNNLAGSGNTGGCAMTRNATSTGIASLSAVQTASKAVAGQPLTYTLTVTNKSYQDAAAALTATETLPAGMTYSQTASGPAPLSVSADRRTVTWRVGVLNPNVCGALYNYWTCLWEEAALPVHSTQVITYQVNTDPNTAIGTTVTNCATMHWSSWAIKPTDLGNSQDKYDFGVPMNINPRSTPACATAKFQPPTVSKGPGGPPAV